MFIASCLWRCEYLCRIEKIMNNQFAFLILSIVCRCSKKQRKQRKQRTYSQLCKESIQNSIDDVAETKPFSVVFLLFRLVDKKKSASL